MNYEEECRQSGRALIILVEHPHSTPEAIQANRFIQELPSVKVALEPYDGNTGYSYGCSIA